MVSRANVEVSRLSKWKGGTSINNNNNKKSDTLGDETRVQMLYLGGCYK